MKFNILDHTGHSELHFTKNQTTKAMAKFEALIKQGSTAATRKAGETDYTVTRSFDPTADETLFIPQMKGG
jgi:hypothetical protein